MSDGGAGGVTRLAKSEMSCRVTLGDKECIYGGDDSHGAKELARVRILDEEAARAGSDASKMYSSS